MYTKAYDLSKNFSLLNFPKIAISFAREDDLSESVNNWFAGIVSTGSAEYTKEDWKCQTKDGFKAILLGGYRHFLLNTI